MTDLAGKKRAKTVYDPDLKEAVLADVRADNHCGSCGEAPRD